MYTPFDLHVLGTPPAFILSQDQTLCSLYHYALCVRCNLNSKKFFRSLLIHSNANAIFKIAFRFSDLLFIKYFVL